MGNDTIKRRILVRLASLGKTAGWLASQIGWAQGNLSSAMLGRRRLPLKRIAGALGVTVQDLTPGNPREPLLADDKEVTT